MFYFNLQYLYLLIPALLLSLYAQAKVSSTFRKYSSVRSASGLTGAETAQRLLWAAGITDVRIERVRGNLTDHYDPSHRVLRLSESVYDSRSLAAVGVAAHETGHAVQHAVGYGPLVLRSAMVPLTNIGSNFSWILIVLGLLFGSQAGSEFGYMLVQAGIVLFALVVVFTLVTLPVELNASSRAVHMLGDNGILTQEELGPVKKVLTAAAMTYVASLAMAVANLLRILALRGRD